MKKRILSAVLVSGVTLGTASATAHADEYDNQIAAQDTIISNLTSEQASAQAQVSAIQSQVSVLQSQKADLEAQNAQLEAEAQQLSSEIQELSNKIVARNQTLKKQARSAQKNSSALSYINTIFNSKSVSDAINRVMAINKVVSANEKMLAEQEADKAAIEAKQAENQSAINTIIANQASLSENENVLATQQADLEVAQLELASQLATAQDEKDAIVAQKAAAEEAARQAAAEEARSVAAAQAAVSTGTATVDVVTETTEDTVSQASTPTVITESEQPEVQVTAAVEEVTPVVTTTTYQPEVTSTPTTQTTTTTVAQTVDTSNTYPVGQCTWGVKSLASWVGNNWGNANQWIASAQAAGYSVGTTPVVGAVAVWPYDGGGYGHVAYVTSVTSSTAIQVMESNYAGNQSIANYRGTFDPTASTWGGGTVYYIYPN